MLLSLGITIKENFIRFTSKDSTPSNVVTFKGEIVTFEGKVVTYG